MGDPIYRLTLAGRGSDGYYKARREGGLGVVDALPKAGGQLLLMCRCVEEDWLLFGLEKWPDLQSLVGFMKVIDGIRMERGAAWEGENYLGRPTPGRGDQRIGSDPIYRVSLLRPYVTSFLSHEMQQAMYAEIFEKLTAAGGRLVLGCRTIEEHRHAFFLEAWPDFDAVYQHVAAMRELQQRYRVQWQAESYLGVKWD